MRTVITEKQQKTAVGARKRRTASSAKFASKNPDKPFEGSDHKPVKRPRGGYAHIGTQPLAAASKKVEEVQIGGSYPAGCVPEAVMVARRNFVLSFMLAGMTSDEIVRQAVAKGMTETATRHIIYEIRKVWKRDLDEGIGYARVETISRLRRDLSLMRAQSPRPYRDIQKHEALLAKIEGTMAPIHVRVFDADETALESFQTIISSMTVDEMRTFIAEGVEMASNDAKQLPSQSAAE